MMISILTCGTSTRAPLNKKMAPQKLRHGAGATCSVLLTRLHPAKLVSDKYTNLEHGRRLSDLICIRQEDKIVSRRLQSCFVYRHGDFEGKELHAVGRWSKVEVEGNFIHYFGSNATNEDEEKDEGASDEVVQIQIPTEILHAGNRAEDIAQVRALGFVVDDDNEPAPENIPTPQENNNDAAADDGRPWGWAGIDYRKQANGQCTKARINFLSGIALEGATMLTMFLLFFPRKFMEDVILVQTNNNLKGGAPVTFGEFLRFLGLWLYMSTLKGFRRSDFWSGKKVSMYEGAPYRLTEFMSMKRFEAILLALTYTDRIPPIYKDRFWEV
jgi:hypothetical protein